jgi:hypothetical protein
MLQRATTPASAAAATELCAGYARVFAVVAAFSLAFSAPLATLLFYLFAFVCDELVRARTCARCATRACEG